MGHITFEVNPVPGNFARNLVHFVESVYLYIATASALTFSAYREVSAVVRVGEELVFAVEGAAARATCVIKRPRCGESSASRDEGG